jgi:hypothetical protein
MNKKSIILNTKRGEKIMKKLSLVLIICLAMFLVISIGAFAVPTYSNVGPTTSFDGDVGVASGKAYYINGTLLSIDDITTEDLIIKADFKDEDWGDVSVSSNSVTLDADVVGTAELADEDWGDVAISGGVASVQDLTITSEAAGDVIYFDGSNWVHLAKDVGKYLKSGAAAVSWDTPAGAGNMSTTTYDTDADGDIDVAAGGTEKSSWTQYAIPYLTATTAFGEIAIGTATQILAVDADADGYEWVAKPVDTKLTEEEVEDFVGGMVTGNTETGIAVTYEDDDGTIDFVVTLGNYVEHFMDVKAADADYCHAAEAGSGESKDVTTALTNPDVPRITSITVTNVSTPEGNVVVTGVLANGSADTDTIVISAGSTAYGVKAFATISKYNIPAGVDAGDTVALGISDKIGLSNDVSAEADVYKKHVDGIDESDEISTKVDATNNTLDCATVVGNEDISVWYHN